MEPVSLGRRLAISRGTKEGSMFPAAIVPFVREAGFAACDPGMAGPRRLPDYLLLHIREGSCLLRIAGAEHDVDAGQSCLIQPDTPHLLRGPSATTVAYARLDIFYNPGRQRSAPADLWQADPAGYRHLLQPRLSEVPGLRVPGRLAPLDPAQFRSTFLRLVGLWQRRDPLSQIEADHCATELVLALLKQYGRPAGPVAPEAGSLTWVTSFLATHLAEPLSVADMAARANLSPSRFAAIFRRQVGSPPHQYLLRLRVRRAEDLLAHTAAPLHEIAEACGFADTHHFSKAFKRLVGTAPGAYRQRPHRGGA